MLIIEILQLLLQTIFCVLRVVFSSLIEVLPELWEMKKLLSAISLTPTNIIANFLGVPAACVSIVFVIAKLAKKVSHI